MPLPTSRTPQRLSATTSKVLLYGMPKVGKSTLAASLDPDHTLFLATEPGLGGLETFQQPIASWADFGRTCKELSEEEHDYTMVVIDTLENLVLFCRDATMKELGVNHPSDLEWGKGWDAVTGKFKMGVSFLASLGMGVWFVDHAKDVEIKQRVGTITKTMPTTTGKPRDFILGFVDHILFATVEHSDDGPLHVVRTKPSENWEAGTRIKAGLPDPLPMDGELLKAEMEAAIAVSSVAMPEAA